MQWCADTDVARVNRLLEETSATTIMLEISLMWNYYSENFKIHTCDVILLFKMNIFLRIYIYVYIFFQ